MTSSATTPSPSIEAFISGESSLSGSKTPSVKSGGEGSVSQDQWTETTSKGTAVGGGGGGDGISAADTAGLELKICRDCNKRHLPRRLVVCVDGTYATPDGIVNAPEGNATNVYRIAAISRRGPVTDAAGKKWYQNPRYFDGIGAEEESSIRRLMAGMSGIGPTGFHKTIRKIYLHCSREACPSQDQLFFFGWSRGAYIVRAVVGLLYYMHLLQPDVPEWDKKFDEALRLLPHAKTKLELHQHKIHRHLFDYTRPSPRVAFVGLFDTVRKVDDKGLFDISCPGAVCILHALALFEDRWWLTPQYFSRKAQVVGNTVEFAESTDIQEAWFAGNHGDIGGGCRNDGLSLWPGQWMLSEARRAGLAIGFKSDEQYPIPDPSRYLIPRGAKTGTLELHNAIRVQLTALDGPFKESRFAPRFNKAAPPEPKESDLGGLFKSYTNAERAIFNGEGMLLGSSSEGSRGTFIHPSVFILDHNVPEVTYAINFSQFRYHLREYGEQMFKNDGLAYWLPNLAQIATRIPAVPRVLLCGAMGSGKSTLINLLIKSSIATVGLGSTSTVHNIEEGLTSPNAGVILHDSSGFEAGEESNYTQVQAFLDSRRVMYPFQDQLHCVWYCVEASRGRIDQAHEDFVSSINVAAVSIILIFTKVDEFRDHCQGKAFRQYQKTHPHIYEIESIPEPDKAAWRQLRNSVLESEKREQIDRWRNLFGDNTSTCFVSDVAQDAESLTQLRRRTEEVMRSDPLITQYHHALRNHLDHKIPIAIEKILDYCENLEDKLKTVKGKNLDFEYKLLRVSLLDQVRPIFGIVLEGFVDFNGRLNAKRDKTRDSWATQQIIELLSFAVVVLPTIWCIEVFRKAFPEAVQNNAVAFIAFLAIGLIVGIPWQLLKPRSATYKVLPVLSMAIQTILIYDHILWYDSERVSQLHVDTAQIIILRKEPRIEEFLAGRLGKYQRHLPKREVMMEIVKDAVERLVIRPIE